MSLIWSRTDGASGPSISIIFDTGELATVGKEHPCLAQITKMLADNAADDEIKALINPVKAITLRLQRLSDRVTTDGSTLFFDGDVLDDSLADYIISLIHLEAEQAEAPSWKPFVNFLEKLAQNPQKESSASLYTFIQNHGLTIRADGDFIAYKGLLEDYTSVHSGPGIVNNVPTRGHLLNKPGSIVELKRSDISSDTSNGCAVGLHAGTASYASSFGKVVVAVAINPRDVVSVPKDSSFQKIRVCRYEVLTELLSLTKAVATVGRDSSPVYTPDVTPPVPSVNEEFVNKLAKAITKGRNLLVEYVSRNGRPATKLYLVKPVSVTGDLVKLVLPNENNAIRTFRIDRIKSIKKVAK